MTMSGVRFTDVTFGYPGGLPVLAGLNVALAPGSLTWVRGENGSGKSTLLKLASGLLRPQAGVVTGPAAIHVAPETTFHEKLTVQEEVWFLESLLPRGTSRFDPALTRWGFDATMRETVVEDLSSGWRQRLVLCLASATHAEVVLLDEPFTNLDTRATELVADWVVTELQRGSCVAVVHHGDPPCLNDVAASVVTLRRGRSSVVA